MGGPTIADSTNTILLVLGISLLSVGLFLLVIWHRSRRVGNTPHCRKCDYNLTGLELHISTAPRCPECGSALRGRRIVRGDRIPRGAAFAGVATVLLLGFALVGRGLWPSLSSLYWDWRPADLLIFDLDSGDSKIVEQAVLQLAHRIQSHGLCLWQRERVIRRSLDVQSGRIGPVQLQEIYPEWLGVFALRNQLDDQQRRDFFRGCFCIEIAARKQALVRFGVPMRFDHTWRGPNAGMRGAFRLKSLTRGGVEISRESLDLSDSVRLGTREVFDWLAPVTEPGNHVLRAELELEVRGSSLENKTETVLYTESRVIEMPVAIVEVLSPEIVALVDDDGRTIRQPNERDKRMAELLIKQADVPGLAAEEQKRLRNEAASLKTPKAPPRDYVPEVSVHGVYLTRQADGSEFAECGVRFPENPLAGLAFDVIVKTPAGREIFLGHVAQVTFAPWQRVYYVKAKVDERLGGLVSVVLRPSAAAAMQTYDLDRIYSGELMFDDLPVMRREEP